MTKISLLPSDTTPTTGDSLPMVRASSGTTVKVLLSDFITFLKANLTGFSTTNLSNPYMCSAYLASSLAVSAATWTKATIATKDFDIGNNFDTVNNRFVATAPGKYLVTWAVGLSDAGMSTGFAEGELRKNGTSINLGNREPASGNANAIPRDGGAKLIQMATNDYLEVWGYISESGRSIAGGANFTFMTVHFVSA